MADAALNLPGRQRGEALAAGEIHQCFICGVSSPKLAELFGKWMCKDRVACYRRWLGQK